MLRPTPITNAADRATRRLGWCLTTLCLSLALAHVTGPAPAQATGTLVATRPPRIASPKAEGSAALASLEQTVTQKINAIRQSHGLSPLVFVPDLLTPAREHSAEMARRNVLSHASANGRGTGDRLDAARIPWLRYGENVALVKGYDNPCNTVVEAWMQSPGHAANILDPLLAESAVGVAAAADGTLYLTQVFVTR